MRPEPNADRYEVGTEPAENTFNLQTPDRIRRPDRSRYRDEIRSRGERIRENIESAPAPDIERLPVPFDFDDADFDN